MSAPGRPKGEDRKAQPEGSPVSGQPEAGDPAVLAQRLAALEAKLCWADDLLDHLNQQVAQQQGHIELLLREVARLRRQVDAAGGPSPFGSAQDEVPPHW